MLKILVGKDLHFYLLGLLVLAMLLIATGCTSVDPRLASLQAQMQETFQYVEQDPDTDTPQVHAVTRPFRGDCDDYAVSAMYQAMVMGYSAEMAMVRTEEGELHTVAVVGDYVLDNRQRRVVTRQALTRMGYEWL